jgi:uncharacterized membrane protein (DUF2068 family)
MHGVAAYGLLRGKRWGPAVAITTCGIELAISLYALVESRFSSVGAAPVAQGLVLVSLLRLRKRWAEIEVPDSQPPNGSLQPPSGEPA